MSQPAPEARIPYLHFAIDSFRNFILANNMTPYVVVELTPGVDEMLDQYAKDGTIVLNLSESACRAYQISEEGYMIVEQRFQGKAHRAFIPVGWVRAMYARENPEYAIGFQGDAFGIQINNGVPRSAFEQPAVETAEEASNVTPLRKGGLTVVK
jgi:Stringent starvation protein B